MSRVNDGRRDRTALGPLPPTTLNFTPHSAQIEIRPEPRIAPMRLGASLHIESGLVPCPQKKDEK